MIFSRSSHATEINTKQHKPQTKNFSRVKEFGLQPPQKAEALFPVNRYPPNTQCAERLSSNIVNQL